MPIATLLLREPASTSLTSSVERSQHQKPPLPVYDIRLNSLQVDFVPFQGEAKPAVPDEGFESDVDTVSIVSSDDSFTSNSANRKSQETDSANGSAGSDSEPETETATKVQQSEKESHHLVDCVCYADIKAADILVFVVKSEVLVFRFGDLDALKGFYVDFSTLKAISNQKTYSFNAKFNLLQRTDKNGVTHIEIADSFHGDKGSRLVNSDHRGESAKNIADGAVKHLQGSKVGRSASTENLLEAPFSTRKIWNSAEDLLDGPKRPERKKKVKSKAPPPPVVKPEVTLKDSKDTLTRLQNFKQRVLPNRDFLTLSSRKETAFQQFRYVEPKRSSCDLALMEFQRFNLQANKKDKKKNVEQHARFYQYEKKFEYPVYTATEPKPPVKKPETKNLWSYSVPRFLRKSRSHSETRNFTPMAYRYIDTTQNYSNVSDRLFGMNPKLKDFSNVDGTMKRKYENWNDKKDGRRNSLGELTFKLNAAGGSLKSVIKKEDNNKKRGNDKKVTFSAYTTVQVV